MILLTGNFSTDDSDMEAKEVFYGELEEWGFQSIFASTAHNKNRMILWSLVKFPKLAFSFGNANSTVAEEPSKLKSKFDGVK